MPKPRFLALALLLFVFSSAQAHTSKPFVNQMAGQTNQYLAMHAKDPVLWQTWSEETIKLAQRSNQPLFISSGYYACHWCHVMQEENYQNKKTAELINRYFIPVKIDRELNPELDNALVAFSKKTTGQGGWPQHAILTPNGAPFSAFIYLTNDELNIYLQKIINLWQNNQQQIITLAENQQAKQQSENKLAPPTQNDFIKSLSSQLMQQKDDLSGGIKGTSKFPRAPLINALLTKQTQSPWNEYIVEWLQTSLDLMQSEHLQDHIHGGFYRYTIDPEWQIPHFEKMTYDSALLAQSYLLAAQHFNRNDYLYTATTTLDYLREHLYNSNVGLYQSSQSAIDKNGIEGGDYLFTAEQLKNKLTEAEFKLVAGEWNFSNPAPYEHGWHPKPIEHELWVNIKQKLSIDVNRIPKDNKSVISWNGLMLSALSHTAIVSELNTEKADNYAKQANDLAKRLISILKKDLAPRAVGLHGELLGTANLEDYAFVLQGLYNYQNLINNDEFNKEITLLEQDIVRLFYQDGQWQFESAPLLNTIQNQEFTKDGPLPSPLASVLCLPSKHNLGRSKINDVMTQDILNNPIDYASYITKPTAFHCD